MQVCFKWKTTQGNNIELSAAAQQLVNGLATNLVEMFRVFDDKV